MRRTRGHSPLDPRNELFGLALALAQAKILGELSYLLRACVVRQSDFHLLAGHLVDLPLDRFLDPLRRPNFDTLDFAGVDVGLQALAVKPDLLRTVDLALAVLERERRELAVLFRLLVPSAEYVLQRRDVAVRVGRDEPPGQISTCAVRDC